MAIEFRCIECGRLLRTADDTAGRQAKCPACGRVSLVPEPGGPSPRPAEVPPETTAGPAGPRPTSDPFAPAGWTPFAPADPENPYQAPAGDAAMAYAYGGPTAMDRVSGPAIGLIVAGSLGLAAYVLGVLFFGIGMVGLAMQQPGPGGAAPILGIVFWIVSFVIGLVISWVVLLGGIRMRRLQSYPLALTASILAVIPAFSPCCLLGVPFGIWALVVLFDPKVRAAFP